MKKLLNLKRLLKARNSSGFTLVEVILSCALLSILILGIMMFVTPVLRMVTSGQKNARATMLSETVDTYIAGVLRTARKIEVFENIEFTSSSTGDLDLSSYGSGISNISTFMSEGTNSLNYEVRALALVCKDEGDVTMQGVRLYNATVDKDTYKLKADTIKTANQALNDLMFEGLYATIFMENFAEQSEDGTPQTDNAKGYKISTVVYNDSKCYDATQEVRDKSIQAFVGVTFFQALNIASSSGETISTIIDPYGYDPANRNVAVQAAMDDHGDHGGKLYYPATIIYYVAPKK